MRKHLPDGLNAVGAVGPYDAGRPAVEPSRHIERIRCRIAARDYLVLVQHDPALLVGGTP